jgi:hypothetical protein
MLIAQRLLRRVLLVFFLVSLVWGTGDVWAAGGDEPETIERQTTITVSYTRYEWWLLRWDTSQLICQVYIDHSGLPSADEILIDCGGDIYRLWINTPACGGLEDGSSQPTQCTGLYLFFIGSEPAEKTIDVDLPPPQVWVELSGCEPRFPDNLCPTLPMLYFTGEEPLPNEHIAALHVLMDGQPFDCLGATCSVPLRPTTLAGMAVEFWADSSFGDSSAHFKAQVRVIDSGVSVSPGMGGWYVDVLSPQWRGNQIASCAQVWQAFPPLGGPPAWLSTPEVPELLATDIPYSYLAGRLISQGLVDASTCIGGGLLSNGYADTCGLELARPLVEEWQNRFDLQIIETAQETGVPAQLMKNIFAQESQFWPGVFRVANEFGLGQLTDNGAETVLLWNPTFFDQFCPLVLDASVCQRGYLYLDGESQALLRGALALQANADCTTCPAGIDLTNAEFSITLFANTLLANCEQVAQIVYNATGQIAGQVSSYEELWRFTVANYHIGPGCLSYAMYTAWAARATMDWEHVSDYLTEPCESVIPYVENVTSIP